MSASQQGLQHMQSSLGHTAAMGRERGTRDRVLERKNFKHIWRILEVAGGKEQGWDLLPDVWDVRYRGRKGALQALGKAEWRGAGLGQDGAPGKHPVRPGCLAPLSPHHTSSHTTDSNLFNPLITQSQKQSGWGRPLRSD